VGNSLGDVPTIIRWDGTNWNNAASPTTANLYSVFMVGAGDGWAVGWAGTIIRWNGVEWVPEFPMAMVAPFSSPPR